MSMTIRQTLIGIAALLFLGPSGAALAFHSVFDYPIDQLTVDGQPFGPRDGTIDLVDDFDDGVLSPFGAFVGTISESGGMLHLQDPGFHIAGGDLSIAFRGTDFATDGSGDVCSTVRWPAGTVPMNGFVIGGLGNGITVEGILVGLVRTDAAMAAATGLPEGLGIFRYRFESNEGLAVAIDDSDVTGDVLSRVCVDDATNLATVSISLDGGSTFLSPFPSTPTYVHGPQLTEGMAAGILLPVGTTTSTTTSTTTTSSTGPSTTLATTTTTSTEPSTTLATTTTTSTEPSTTLVTTTTTSTEPSTTLATTTTTSITTTTSTVPDCGGAPRTDCNPAGEGTLSVREGTPGFEQLKAVLVEFQQATPLQDLGDPVNGVTAYTLCVYAANDTLAAQLQVARAGDTCSGRPCWRAIHDKGWKYDDHELAADGVLKIRARGGEAGRGKLVFKAENDAPGGQTNLPAGIAAALSGSSHATVQVVVSDGACFGGVLDDVRRDDAGTFKAIKR